jgi:branched-chain amino acid transport system permease protein
MTPSLSQSELLARHTVRWAEAVLWVFALATYFLFPGYLALATLAVIMALFALSLDVAMGFAGIVSLGHAIFFGLGAYCAGLLALAGFNEAITGAAASGALAALMAALIGPLILRLTGLPLLMVTLALGVIAYEVANKLTWLTGGDDGLQGIELKPLLGMFPFTVYGHTGYLYALSCLFVAFIATRRLLASPFGVALQGIRENRERMTLIGAPVLGHLVRAYVISAFMAGVAGALSAQTTRFVGLAVFSLDNSADVMVMLVLGGIGRLYGGLIGAPIYVTIKDFAATWNPYHWMFVIGALLVVVVRFAQGGILGMVDLAIRAMMRR